MYTVFLLYRNLGLRVREKRKHQFPPSKAALGFRDRKKEILIQLESIL